MKCTVWSNNSTSGYISKVNEITTPNGYLHPHDHCSIIYVGKTWQQPMCPSVDEQINRYMCVCNGILLIYKKGSSAIRDNMDGSWGYDAEISQTKDKFSVISVICKI